MGLSKKSWGNTSSNYPVIFFFSFSPYFPVIMQCGFFFFCILIFESKNLSFTICNNFLRLPGYPGVKSSCSNAGGTVLILGQGTEIPTCPVVQPEGKKKVKLRNNFSIRKSR